ncbi:hypothetical protein BWQ96_01996 [Gracilariopsis chorda]|uniref:Uncharacterized protein n=1 Tax=Gracilariopsis chorda TaxID=448386 RepID=A0A2V3J2T8_9FLOR|nr:hypothetical protein BWQ96_01996 [Gracilariopsis chorda]|eukprot:PXF48307.1 hypothetical protein BWQ96_01996 [Gracilariopsis chorda]
MLASAWLAKKRFTASQASLVDEFGHVIALYGNSPDAEREIASDYKRKLSPGLLGGAMFASYLGALISGRAIDRSIIQNMSLVKNCYASGIIRLSTSSTNWPLE